MSSCSCVRGRLHLGRWCCFGHLSLASPARFAPRLACCDDMSITLPQCLVFPFCMRSNPDMLRSAVSGLSCSPAIKTSLCEKGSAKPTPTRQQPVSTLSSLSDPPHVLVSVASTQTILPWGCHSTSAHTTSRRDRRYSVLQSPRIRIQCILADTSPPIKKVSILQGQSSPYIARATPSPPPPPRVLNLGQARGTRICSSVNRTSLPEQFLKDF